MTFSEAALALQEFHLFYDLPMRLNETVVQPGDELELRKTLIREEVEELFEPLDAGDFVNAYKELADLVYVAYGLDQHMGNRLDEVFAEVHRSVEHPGY